MYFHYKPAVVRKNNSALRISTIRAIGSDVKSTLRVGRIADVTSADPEVTTLCICWQLVGSTANGFIAEHRRGSTQWRGANVSPSASYPVGLQALPSDSWR